MQCSLVPCIPYTRVVCSVLVFSIKYTKLCSLVGKFNLTFLQDLKDYMRQAGEVTYADAHRPYKGEGYVLLHFCACPISIFSVKIFRV